MKLVTIQNQLYAKGSSTESKPAEKAESLVSGLRVKRRCWLNVIRKPGAAIETNGLKKVSEVT